MRIDSTCFEVLRHFLSKTIIFLFHYTPLLGTQTNFRKCRSRKKFWALGSGIFAAEWSCAESGAKGPHQEGVWARLHHSHVTEPSCVEMMVKGENVVLKQWMAIALLCQCCSGSTTSWQHAGSKLACECSIRCSVTSESCCRTDSWIQSFLS